MDQESVALQVLPRAEGPRSAAELGPRVLSGARSDGTLVEQPQDDWFGAECQLDKQRLLTARTVGAGSAGVAAAAAAQSPEDLIITVRRARGSQSSWCNRDKKVDNVHKSYLLGVEAVPALRGVSLSIRRGEFVCLFGTSGGGKVRASPVRVLWALTANTLRAQTTLLNLLGTIDKPSRGYIHVCGTKIGSNTSDKVGPGARHRRFMVH